MADICGDNRFELIEKYKQKLLDVTNIEDSPEEMAVIDNVLFRLWQIGWLEKLELFGNSELLSSSCGHEKDHVADPGKMVGDSVSRQAVIDAIESVDWYHINESGEMVNGANDSDHQAWYKAEDIYRTVESLPSAQPVNTAKLQPNCNQVASDCISRKAAIEAVGQIKRTDNWRAAVAMVLCELPPTRLVSHESIIDTITTAIDNTDGDNPHDVGVRNGMRWCRQLFDKNEPEYEKPPTQRWILATPETMPDSFETVYVTVSIGKCRYVTKGVVVNGKWEGVFGGGRVVAWMPITYPKPYDGELDG